MRMTRDTKLVDEILTCASATPLDYQEHILDVVKAMLFTRSVVQKELNNHKNISEKNKTSRGEPGTYK